ncbi:hypothetical protein [Peterkaempfera bronchialis]|uniref:hypothetical protein n=1 Tax=Peterkaempfera bronchialis TaxID=2126346 RepID=UPI0013B3DD6B|nr:hypothetical protein [Peterkaempfera bronchialis]
MGPLPASIYWRRRFVVLVALLAVAALIVWLTVRGGGGNEAQGKHPAPVQSITPGSSPSGSAITTRPGGGSGGGSGSSGKPGTGSSESPGAEGGTSDSGGGSTEGTTGGTGGTGGSDVSLSGGSSGSGSSGGSGGSAGSAGSTGSTGSTSNGGSGSTSGGSGTVQIDTAAVRALPICPTSKVSLELTSVQNAYQPKDRPRFELTVRNSGPACRADLGRMASLITVSEASAGRVWSSGDCPTDRSSTWVGIPAGGAVTETFVWDRSRSIPECPTPAPGGTAGDGVYLVQASLSGVSGTPVTARASFRLES